MFQGQTVYTPYGLGKITLIRLHDLVVVPLNWLMAGGQKPTFYMNNKDVKPYYNIGMSVQCSFGQGEVKEIRNDGIYVVTLKNWQLADGKSPTLYLNETSLSIPSVVPTKSVVPEQSASDKCIEKAMTLKQEASEYFKSGDNEKARMKYLEAVEQLQVFPYLVGLSYMIYFICCFSMLGMS